MTQHITYRGYHIRFDPPPIPVRDYDWKWHHDGFDGSWDANDFRCGASASLEAAEAAIDEQIHSLTDEFEGAKKTITETIGFNFEPGELQTVNADDLIRLAAALKADGSADEAAVEINLMRTALERIAGPRDCGCSPSCQCNSQESLEIEVDALRDIAIAALKGSTHA